MAQCLDDFFRVHMKINGSQQKEKGRCWGRLRQDGWACCQRQAINAPESCNAVLAVSVQALSLGHSNGSHKLERQ